MSQNRFSIRSQVYDTPEAVHYMEIRMQFDKEYKEVRIRLEENTPPTDFLVAVDLLVSQWQEELDPFSKSRPMNMEEMLQEKVRDGEEAARMLTSLFNGPIRKT